MYVVSIKRRSDYQSMEISIALFSDLKSAQLFQDKMKQNNDVTNCRIHDINMDEEFTVEFVEADGYDVSIR